MIKIVTDNIELLQDICESLAYKIANYENPNQHSVSDEQVVNILRCEGLEVVIEDAS